MHPHQPTHASTKLHRLTYSQMTATLGADEFLAADVRSFLHPQARNPSFEFLVNPARGEFFDADNIAHIRAPDTENSHARWRCHNFRPAPFISLNPRVFYLNGTTMIDANGIMIGHLHAELIEWRFNQQQKLFVGRRPGIERVTQYRQYGGKEWYTLIDSPDGEGVITATQTVDRAFEFIEGRLYCWKIHAMHVADSPHFDEEHLDHAGSLETLFYILPPG